MNPIAFMLAVTFIVFLFPIFQGIAYDCFYRAFGTRSARGRMVGFMLGTTAMAVFCALCFGLLWVGTQPRAFFN